MGLGCFAQAQFQNGPSIPSVMKRDPVPCTQRSPQQSASGPGRFRPSPVRDCRCITMSDPRFSNASNVSIDKTNCWTC